MTLTIVVCCSRSSTVSPDGVSYAISSSSRADDGGSARSSSGGVSVMLLPSGQ